MLQQAGVSALCEKFHLYRLEKLVAISKFLDSYYSRIIGGGKVTGWFIFTPGGQDKPAGICCPPGVKISREGVGYLGTSCPRRQPVHGWLAPRGQPVQGGKINWDTGTGNILFHGFLDFVFFFACEHKEMQYWMDDKDVFQIQSFSHSKLMGGR